MPPADEGRDGEPTGSGETPSAAPTSQTGPPLFVNPEHLAAQQYDPPTFVRPDGRPIAPSGPPVYPTSQGAQPGAPLFLKPDGSVAGGAPAGVAAPVPAPGPTPGAALPGGYHVAGGEPGGPVFVARDREPVQVDDDRPWAWWVGPVAFAVAFAVVLVMGIFLAIAFSAGGGDVNNAFDNNEHWLGLAQDVLWVGVVLLVPYLAVRYLRPEQLGLRRQPIGRSLGILIATLIAFYLVAYLYSEAAGLTEDSNDMLNDTGFGDSVGRDVALALLFTVAAPVAEELLFRGLLFRTLRDAFMARVGRKTGVALGALISGVIFGGIHVGGGQDAFLPVLMALGVLLALAYHWSGTLYVPVVLHAINNALATGANAEPSADWIYGVIAAGPFIAVAVLFVLSRFIRAVFPQERPDAPAPPLGGLPVQPSGRPANL